MKLLNVLLNFSKTMKIKIFNNLLLSVRVERWDINNEKDYYFPNPK